MTRRKILLTTSVVIILGVAAYLGWMMVFQKPDSAVAEDRQSPEAAETAIVLQQSGLQLALESGIEELERLHHNAEEWRLFSADDMTPQDYRLVGAQHVPVGGQYLWRLTFKPVNLIAKDPSQGVIGAGGEIFVNVNVETGQCVVTGGE